MSYALSLHHLNAVGVLETSEPISKRARHSTVTGHMLETLEELEHGVVPPYLQDVNTWRVSSTFRRTCRTSTRSG